MSGSIPLHPDRVLDPHLTYCPRCGGDGKGITIGHLRKARLKSDKTGEKTWVYANRGQTRKTEKELAEAGHMYHHARLDWMDVRENEKVPDSDVCDDCTAEMEEFEREIKAGGIFWRCQSCNREGVIKGTAPVAAAVKEQAGVAPDEPAGIEFEKCEEHGGDEDEQEEPPLD